MARIDTVDQLDAELTRPSAALIEDIARLEGDIMILGVGGKMGPTLARLAKNAVRAAGVEKRIIGVSRFSSGGLEQELQAHGVETIAADLFNEAQLKALPDVPNIIYMVGYKFGTTGQEHMTWAMNAYLPGRVAERFKGARTVVFSTGNVYPLTPVTMGGAWEGYPTGPVGEYAQSCLGRERVYEHFARVHKTPTLIFRLNYAIDLRYGVLLDVAQKVKAQQPVDVSMGHANVIWQGDANEIAIRCLHACDVPPKILNVTGPETVSVRWLAGQFGELFGVEPIIQGVEQETALLSNAALSNQLFGYPRVSLRQMIEWTAHWVNIGGPTLNKPTHFQQREGKF